MISDVLSEAVAEMDRYLNGAVWADTYTDQTREEIVALRTLMDAARRRLDTPPAPVREVTISVRHGVVIVKV